MLDKLAVTLQCDIYVPKRVCKLCCADPQLGTPYLNLTEIKVKKCSCCKTVKHYDNFNKNKSQKDGYDNNCKDCRKLSRLTNADKTKKYMRDWRNKNPNARKNYYDKNKESVSLYAKEYRKLNRDKLLLNSKNWRISNLDKDAAKTARRRASKLKATPPWLTKQDFEQIKELYEVTKAFRLYTGEEYHVDHIVPLQGENVCGLHVPWNLQVISAKENLSKHNKLIQE